jgi:hypothetical protein
MAEQATFRFGVLHPEEDEPPSVEMMGDRVDEGQLRIGLQERDWAQRIYEDFDDAYYFTYVTEIEDEYERVDDNGNIEQDSRFPIFTSRVLYFDNGGFVFESREDIPETRIPAFILNEDPAALTPDEDFTIFQGFTQDQIQAEYDTASEVSRVKFRELGTDEVENDDLLTLIEGLGNEVSSLQLSRGRSTTQDLKRSELINEFVSVSELDQLTYYTTEGERRVMTSSGRIEISAPEEPVVDEATVIRNHTEPFLTEFL